MLHMEQSFALRQYAGNSLVFCNSGIWLSLDPIISDGELHRVLYSRLLSYRNLQARIAIYIQQHRYLYEVARGGT